MSRHIVYHVILATHIFVTRSYHSSSKWSYTFCFFVFFFCFNFCLANRQPTKHRSLPNEMHRFECVIAGVHLCAQLNTYAAPKASKMREGEKRERHFGCRGANESFLCVPIVTCVAKAHWLQSARRSRDGVETPFGGECTR